MADTKHQFPTQPSLVGKEIYLRPATPEDAANFQFWFLQSEPQSMTSRAVTFMTPAEAVEAQKKREKSPDQQVFVIVTKEGNLPVGKLSFFNLNNLNRSAELGIMVDPEKRKHKHATEAMRLVIRFLFRYRNLNKVYAETAAYNKPAIKLLESIGFKKDGVLRSHYYFDGEYHDKLVYSFMHFELNW